LSEADLLDLLAATRLATWECAVRSVAHALGTPLNIVLGHAELLLDDTTGGSGAHSITNQVRSMEKLINRSIEFPSTVPRASDDPISCEELSRRVTPFLVDEGGVGFALDGSSVTLPASSGFLMMLGLARYGAARAPADAVPQIHCERTATHTTLRLSCSSPLAGARSARELAEPWLLDPVDTSSEGMELAVAMAACRRLRGAVTRDDQGSGFRLNLSWPH
jgi:hypothetical protein